ncbi:hypothetical protein NCCP436_15140 [Pseudomonas sp. NCCP-436]|nr:hypothetical protein NCCP436_15140 [Pseudomonas sp. NCCP-436]
MAVGQQRYQQAVDQSILAKDLAGKKLSQGNQGVTVFHRRALMVAMGGRCAPPAVLRADFNAFAVPLAMYPVAGDELDISLCR